MDNKVFILGDSRTGTTSVNSFLCDLNIPSKHYFVKEANQLYPDVENRSSNLKELLKYINNSGYQGFSDYPTRLYFKELHEAYPDAYFILTTRKSEEVWLKSMFSYFKNFNIKLNKKEILTNYCLFNNDIEIYFGNSSNKFLSIAIDGSNSMNSKKIKELLGIKSLITIPHQNRLSDFVKNET